MLGRKQGRLDSPLTEQGREQARRNAAIVAGLGLDAVFASPLGRALDTARLLVADTGLAVTVLPDLAELDHGEFAGLTTAEILARDPAAWAARRADKYHWRFPGGESYADADARAARALTEATRRGARRPLFVSHEMVGRMLLRNLLGLTPDQAFRRSQPNHVVFQVERGQVTELSALTT